MVASQWGFRNIQGNLIDSYTAICKFTRPIGIASNFKGHLPFWGGDYWANFLHSVIFPIFGMLKTLVTCTIARSYLPEVTAAELRRHMANINVIEST